MAAVKAVRPTHALPGDKAILRALPPGTLLPPNSMAFRAVLGADLRRRMDEAELIADPETREARLFACRALLALSEAVPTAEEGGHA
ncbi:hypothetical protein RADP37_05490 (plasmid) [Roseomonas mucosa]|uniref:Uncharacterized protein n=1 Tax=Roseomonas mucosa TaxID=207340 RepID=A0A4Y1MPV8_9PROT|nr:hypothetical protein RADP37_05490 [Roseomonas mucosa]